MPKSAFIEKEDCGRCTVISKSTSIDDVIHKDDKWQIGDELVEANYSLCENYSP